MAITVQPVSRIVPSLRIFLMAKLQEKVNAKADFSCVHSISNEWSVLVAQDVRYNFDSKADFTKFKTYKWVDIKGTDKPNPLVQKQITDTIDAELAKKGLTKTDSDTADLLIGYQTAVGTEKQFNSYNTGWGYGPGWGGGWYGGGGMTTTTGSTSTIYVGELDLDDRAPARIRFGEPRPQNPRS